jgi:putative ABC transport system permease protein
MIHLDRWQEIYDTIRRNKLRTALTAVSVAWGIFMLVLLLGTGRGLQNAVEHGFRDDAINSVFIRGGTTSLPHQGMPLGRQIRFTKDDYELLAQTEGVERLSGRFFRWGGVVVSYRGRTASFDMRAVHPDHQYIEKSLIQRGRFINDLDLRERRKVAVIGLEVAQFLFGGADPLGAYIDVGGLLYKVIGTFDDEGDEGELRTIYLPITTAQQAYDRGERIHQLLFTFADDDLAGSLEMVERVRVALAERHRFHPDDPRALRISNNVERFEETRTLFHWIRIFVAIVGVGTVLAGLVAVSNIMMISVKERTREIGLRKALGATPASIIGLILQEAVLITAVAGYLGMVTGVGVLELAAWKLPDNDYLRDPQVEMGTVLLAALLLVAAGALAGYWPARRAARVNPIVALRDE